MSIIFKDYKLWGTANWVTRALFQDIESYLDQTPVVGPHIKMCINLDLDTLDLRDMDLQCVSQMEFLVQKAIQDNKISQGSNFHDPTVFPVYIEKLEELGYMIHNVLNDMSIE